MNFKIYIAYSLCFGFCFALPAVAKDPRLFDKTASKNETETRVWKGASSSFSSRSSKESIFSLISTFWNKNKVRTLAEKCGYLAKRGSIVNIDAKNIVSEFKPMIKQGLTKENVLKMSSIMEKHDSEIQEILSCLVPQLDMGNLEFAHSLSVTATAAAGASGTAEIGVAVSKGSKGQIVGFASGCYGMKTDVSVGGGVVFGVWKSLDSVPGGSFALGAGIDAPGTELGASAGIVWSIPNGDLIGGTYGLGLAGVGLSPIEISVDKCFTNDLFYL